MVPAEPLKSRQQVLPQSIHRVCGRDKVESHAHVTWLNLSKLYIPGKWRDGSHKHGCGSKKPGRTMTDHSILWNFKQWLLILTQSKRILFVQVYLNARYKEHGFSLIIGTVIALKGKVMRVKKIGNLVVWNRFKRFYRFKEPGVEMKKSCFSDSKTLSIVSLNTSRTT